MPPTPNSYSVHPSVAPVLAGRVPIQARVPLFALVFLVLASVAGAQAPAPEGGLNPELARLYEADQADRAGTLKDTDWAAVEKRDAERRQRVLEILEKGGAREAADYYHAAMVFQHGIQPEDHDRAHAWCLEALKLAPDHAKARWLAAASKDRALMWRSQPQLYGTQFKKVDGKWILWEVDPSITDEERAKWGVPPLAVAKERVEKLNAGTFEPH